MAATSRGYNGLVSNEQVAEYRAKKDQEKADRERDAAKAEADAAKAASKKRRDELEQGLKSRWLASGGTEREWLSQKARLISDAIAKEVLAPDPEPAPKKPVPLPMARSRYRN